MKTNFFCPKCASDVLEEIMVNVIVSGIVSEIDVDVDGGVADLFYDGQTNEGGQVHRYQCGDCGYILRNENDSVVVTTPEELNAWMILAYGMGS